MLLSSLGILDLLAYFILWMFAGKVSAEHSLLNVLLPLAKRIYYLLHPKILHHRLLFLLDNRQLVNEISDR